MRDFKHIKHIFEKSKSNRLQTYRAPPGYIKFGVFMIFTVMTALYFINGIGAEQQYTDGAACDDITKDKIIGISDGIPDSIREYLPDEIFSEDYDSFIESLGKISDSSYLYNSIASSLKKEIGGFFRLTATLLGLIIFACIIKTVKESMVSGKMQSAFAFCADTAILAAFVSGGFTGITGTIQYIESLNIFISGILPATSALYASGGNVKTALVGTAGFMTFLAVSSYICNTALKAVTSVCIALTLCSAIAPSINLKSLGNFIKKTFFTILSFIMMILLFSMSVQTSLSSAQDSISARTAKFFVGNIIPVVGGSVSDTIRTLSTSISFLRKTIGLGSVIIILIMFIPHAISLFLTRTAYNMCGAFADILGCDKQGSLLREIGSIYGNIIAVTTVCSIMFIFSLTMFAGSTVAISQ